MARTHGIASTYDFCHDGPDGKPCDLCRTNAIVSRDGKTLAITFENNTTMTAVKLTRNMALKLIADLQTLIEIEG